MTAATIGGTFLGVSALGLCQGTIARTGTCTRSAAVPAQKGTIKEDVVLAVVLRTSVQPKVECRPWSTALDIVCRVVAACNASNSHTPARGG